MNEDKPRLIEVTFPLKQASLDSVHEKNVRHGHISTLHIWPARRPLAACRAALIATLLPDPGNDIEREYLMDKIAGVIKQENTFKMVGDRKIPVIKEFTDGGILHWGRENGPDLDYFREEIKKAFGGRAPRVLDPFAGGGAIPLEAMRLGCDVTAVDINPVAWFILKCTLEYPQQFAGKTRPLPSFALQNSEFMEKFLKGSGKAVKPSRRKENATQPSLMEIPEANLSWHVRAWGYWVLERARKDLEKFYPIVDNKPTVAYLWARTVTCKNCRATIPLLKTLWLRRNAKKRERLQMNIRPDRSGVDFGIVNEPTVGGNAGQRRAHDQQVGKGTMSASGAWCPVCGSYDTVAMTKDDIKADMISQNKIGHAVEQMTTVAVDTPRGKEFRLPTKDELEAASSAQSKAEEAFNDIPFGLPKELIWEDAKGSTWCVQYGFDRWYKLFNSRQLVALSALVKHTRAAQSAIAAQGYPKEWQEALSAYLASAIDRFLDFSNTNVQWKLDAVTINHSFVRFALPLSWDFAEGNPIGTNAGSYSLCLERVNSGLDTLIDSGNKYYFSPNIYRKSATEHNEDHFDVIMTDPPYYDAIPYSNTMDFFYVWLRRVLHGLNQEVDDVFKEPFCPKWDAVANDGELVDDASRSFHRGRKK